MRIETKVESSAAASEIVGNSQSLGGQKLNRKGRGGPTRCDRDRDRDRNRFTYAFTLPNRPRVDQEPLHILILSQEH